DAEIAKHEIPLADPTASPKYVSSDYYYRIPVRPIYKSYPVYAPGHEPSGYMDWLKQQEPVVVWDDRGHAPALRTDADWIRAGEIVVEAPNGANAYIRVEDVRNPIWYQKTGALASKDGVLSEFQYEVRTQGVVELGANACARCHTRVMPDGSLIKGAQSNQPSQREVAFGIRTGAAASSDKAQYLARLRGFL